MLLLLFAFLLPAWLVAADDGYLQFPGVGTYRLSSQRANWTQARSICAAEGSYLAVVNSEMEANVLRGLMAWAPDAGNYAYLGFGDQAKEGEYITIFGDPLASTGFDHWAPSSPAGTKQFNCGCLQRSGGLCDYVCDGQIPFFCEKQQP